jgi:hypothetical protein
MAVRRSEIVGKMIQEQRGRGERERERTMREDKTVNVRRMLGSSPRSQYALIANSINVFKFCLLNVCKREYGI